jgi:exosortase/archaeosortase family protein
MAGGRAYLGLALLGWGLSILLGVTPHEDPVVGAALAAFGATLVVTAPRLPRFSHLSPPLVAATGLAMAILVLAYDAWSHAALDLPKGAIVLFGAGLATAAPLLKGEMALARPGNSKAPMATLVTCAIPVLGGPLAMWAAQAAFKTALGTTPIEAFVRIALLAPLGLILSLVGLHTSVRGQTVTYFTPRGPLSLEVGAACSGVQAMALFAGVLALYLVAERPGGRRLALWCCIGLFGVYIANLLRLVMLFVVGYQWGPDALLRAHAEAGWMFFVAWAIAFARLARNTPRAA